MKNPDNGVTPPIMREGHPVVFSRAPLIYRVLLKNDYEGG